MRFFSGAMFWGAVLASGCGGDGGGERTQTSVRRVPTGGKADAASDHCEGLQRCCQRHAGALKPVCLDTVVERDGDACAGALVAYECDDAPAPPEHDARYL